MVSLAMDSVGVSRSLPPESLLFSSEHPHPLLTACRVWKLWWGGRRVCVLEGEGEVRRWKEEEG